MPAGTEVYKDTTCDSSFMLKHIHDIGKAIRKSYHWVPREDTIYLIMDNAVGHGTNATKTEYTKN